jgi:apolipoprotein D and lipocalin family protein
MAAALLADCAHENRPLPTAPKVDLARYAGKWFEVARLPNVFQRDDSRALAEYTPQPDGAVKVRNTELRPNGTTKAIEGTATAVPGSGNARLKVRFGGLAALAPVPAEGNYWIIAVEPDYSAALVGTPDRKYLWLLARSPQPNPKTRDRLIARARELGFAVERLIPPQRR